MVKELGKRLSLAILNLFSRLEPLSGDDVTDFSEKKENVENMFVDSFFRRSKQYLLILAVLGIVCLIDWFYAGIDIPAYGLAIDGFGALVLVRSVIRGEAGIARDTPEQVGRLGGDGMNLLNQKALRAVAENTIDGLWGGVLLFCGFIIQILFYVI